MNSKKMGTALVYALLAAAAVPSDSPVRRHRAEPRREPYRPKPQRSKPGQRTPEDEARMQAAAERRAKRNAKWANQGNSNE